MAHETHTTGSAGHVLADPTYLAAQALGFPAITLRVGVYVHGGEANWRRFVAWPSVEDRIESNVALAALMECRRG